MYEGNYRLVFLASIIPGAIAILLLIFFLSRKFIWFSLIITLFTLGNFSDAFLALRAQDVGMNVALIPFAFFAFNLISSLFSMPVGMLSDRIGRRPVLISGLFIFAIIYFGFGLADHIAWIGCSIFYTVDLDRLEQGQLQDGGWAVDFTSYSDAASLEWRGYVTVGAVAVLRMNGR
jgi:MFS family permease